MNSIEDKFIGVWRLISCTQTNEDGTVLYPWGEDAIGYIMYSKENIMAVQIMRSHRNFFHVNDWSLASAEECSNLPKEYNAYFGTYDINQQSEVITHHIQGHLLPNLVGKKNIRKYQFNGNRLLLTTVEGIKRDMMWERVNHSFL